MRPTRCWPRRSCTSSQQGFWLLRGLAAGCLSLVACLVVPGWSQFAVPKAIKNMSRRTWPNGWRRRSWSTVAAVGTEERTWWPEPSAQVNGVPVQSKQPTPNSECWCRCQRKRQWKQPRPNSECWCCKFQWRTREEFAGCLWKCFDVKRLLESHSVMGQNESMSDIDSPFWCRASYSAIFDLAHDVRWSLTTRAWIWSDRGKHSCSCCSVFEDITSLFSLSKFQRLTFTQISLGSVLFSQPLHSHSVSNSAQLFDRTSVTLFLTALDLLTESERKLIKREVAYLHKLSFLLASLDFYKVLTCLQRS